MFSLPIKKSMTKEQLQGLLNEALQSLQGAEHSLLKMQGEMAPVAWQATYEAGAQVTASIYNVQQALKNLG